jgi:exodeoxyribonuclease VII large subunit
MNSEAVLGLHELHVEIGACVEQAFPHAVWVAAEIISLNENRTGHCYLELIEKEEDGAIIARAKATIWASLYRKIKPYFMQATGMPLAVGMMVALQVEVVFHPAYGLSLNVHDINPAFTVGNRLLQRNNIIQRLHNEGVFDMNKELSLPALPARLAVVSAQTAAGYGDFMNELTQNQWGFPFQVTLFPALVQGELAQASMVKALHQIAEQWQDFDAVVIIRGGGSVADLSCFDGYDLAYLVTQMPLPVVVGVGHDRDVSVLDMVASLSLKTPTAVAQYMVQQFVQAYQKVLSLQERITKGVENVLHKQQQRLQTIEALLPVCAMRLLEKKESKLHLLERSVELLSPLTILKKGYTMTLKNGVVASFADIKPGDEITTVFHNGSIHSKIHQVAQ